VIHASLAMFTVQSIKFVLNALLVAQIVYMIKSINVKNVGMDSNLYMMLLTFLLHAVNALKSAKLV